MTKTIKIMTLAGGKLQHLIQDDPNKKKKVGRASFEQRLLLMISEKIQTG